MACGLLAVGCDKNGGDEGPVVSGIRVSSETSAAEYAASASHVRLYLADPTDNRIEKSYSFNSLGELEGAALNLPLEQYSLVLFANLDPDVFEVPEVGEQIDLTANCPIKSGAVVERPLLRAFADVSNTAAGVNLELQNLMTRLTFDYPAPAEGPFSLTIQAPVSDGASYEVSCNREFEADAPDFSVSYCLYPAARGEVDITGTIGSATFSFTPDQPDALYEQGHDYLFTIHGEPLGRSGGSAVPHYFITLNR